MKKFLIILLFISSLLTSAFSEVAIKQEVCFYDYGFAYEHNAPASISVLSPLTLSNRTTVSASFINVFDISSDFISNNNTLTTNNSFSIKYDFTDNFQLFGTLALNYTNTSNYKFNKAIHDGYCLYSDASVGAKINTDIWYLNVFAEGSLGYSYLDIVSITSRTDAGMMSVEKSDKGFIVDLKVGASYGKYVIAFAGIKSWQNAQTLIVWQPYSIENYIGIIVDVPLYKNISIVSTILHSCRHTESPIGSTYPKKDISYSIISAGLKLSL